MQIKGHGAKLPQKQGKAITALLLCDTLEKAAKQIGIAPSTLYRWLQDTEFNAAYRAAKIACVSQAIGRIQQISGEAVETLRAIMIDKDKPSSTRVAAARCVLEISIKSIELEDMEDRITAIEEKISKGVR